MNVFHNSWNELDGKALMLFLSSSLPSLAVLPDFKLLKELKRLKTATLEVLELRTESTVFSIRQTGEVFHVFQNTRSCTYKSYQEYLDCTAPVDSLLSLLSAKPAAHHFYEVEGKYYVVRLKHPRFVALLSGAHGRVTAEITQWIDQKPQAVSSLSLVRKAEAFAKAYINLNHNEEE